MQDDLLARFRQEVEKQLRVLYFPTAAFQANCMASGLTSIVVFFFVTGK